MSPQWWQWKDSKIDRKYLFCWVHEVFQQPCRIQHAQGKCEAEQARLCSDDDSWWWQNPDIWFYYNTLKKQYGAKCELIYTERLLLEIQTDVVDNDMEDKKYLYDTSDYPKD